MWPQIQGFGFAVKAIKARRRALRESGVSDEEVVRREQQMLLDARRKVEAEVDQLKKDPTAPIPPPGEILATLTPDALGEVVVRRGAVFRKDGQLVLPKRGSQGFVKIVLRHSDVTDKELLQLPIVLRERAPIFIQNTGIGTVQRCRLHVDGVEVTYALRIEPTASGRRNYVISIFRETDRRKFKGESPKLGVGGPDPRSKSGPLSRDTG